MVDYLPSLAAVQPVEEAALGGLQAQRVVGGQVRIADSEHLVILSNRIQKIFVSISDKVETFFFLNPYF